MRKIALFAAALTAFLNAVHASAMTGAKGSAYFAL